MSRLEILQTPRMHGDCCSNHLISLLPTHTSPCSQGPCPSYNTVHELLPTIERVLDWWELGFSRCHTRLTITSPLAHGSEVSETCVLKRRKKSCLDAGPHTGPRGKVGANESSRQATRLSDSDCDGDSKCFHHVFGH